MVFSANGTKTANSATAFIGFTVIYALFAYFGLNWAMIGGAGSPIWPAAGVGLAGLIIGGARLWPAIVIGRTIAALLAGSQQPFLAEVFLGLANALASLAGCALIRIMGGTKVGLPTFGDVLRYLFAGAIPYAVLVAVIGILTLKLSSGLRPERMLAMFGLCITGHFVGAATVGTFILSWWRPKPLICWRDAIHFALLFGATAIATLLVFSTMAHGVWPTWQLLPFLVWTAIAFDIRGTSAMLISISLIAMFQTGVLAFPNTGDPVELTSQIWMLQELLATQTLTMLLLTAAVDERRTQAEFKRRDLMLREALSASAAGIFRWTFTTNQVECDETLLRLLGTTAAHAPKHLEDLIAVLHPDDQLRLLTLYEDCARKGTEISTTTRVALADGESRTLNVRGRCIDNRQGNIGFVTGAVIDITEQSKLERRLAEAEHIYRAVFEQAGVGVARLSLKGTFLEVNERFCAIADRPHDQLVGVNWLAISKDPKWDSALGEFAAMLKSGHGQFRVERSYSDPKRDPFWVDMSITLVHDAQNLPLFYLAVVQDVSEGKRAEARERLLSREVNHRSKNVLAIVQAIIQLTEAPDLQAYRTRIAGRIQSLSRTHNLLAETKWDGVQLMRVVQDELSPFEAAEETASDHGRFSVDGPEIVLKPAAAQAFALLLHEMITNAVKYGSLTARNGHVQIHWAHKAGETAMLRFTWRESGGPAVKAPDRNGFGWTVIRSSIEEQMRGTLTTEWTETGLNVGIDIPLRELTEQPVLQAAS